MPVVWGPALHTEEEAHGAVSQMSAGSEGDYMADNLMEGLIDELNRNRELLKDYESIGAPGMFGGMVIRKNIADGEQAIKDGDVVAMLEAYVELRSNK